MRVGVKYCGGCNPRFDRSAVAARMRGDFPDAQVVSVSDGGTFDAVAVICGCQSKCASHDGLDGRFGKVVLGMESDYAQLRALLERAHNESKE